MLYALCMYVRTYKYVCMCYQTALSGACTIKLQIIWYLLLITRTICDAENLRKTSVKAIDAPAEVQHGYF
jgi:hypothetical protein